MAEYSTNMIVDNCSHYIQDLHSAEGMLVHNWWLVVGFGSYNHYSNYSNCSGKLAGCYVGDELDGIDHHVAKRESFPRLHRCEEF